jgi:uncharacterized membrane protein
MNIKMIKGTAKQKLTGFWGIAIGVYFIQALISGISQSFLSIIALFFISGPLMVGYFWFHLALERKQNPTVGSLFDGFNTNYMRNAFTNFLMQLLIMLWSLLLIIPGIIKALAYSMTYFILRDRPELTALQAITESRRLMNGKKKDLFLLSLSFLAWFIIPLLLIIIGSVSTTISTTVNGEIANEGLFFSGMGSFIIGFIALFGISIYLMPYITTSLAVFYDEYVKPKETLTTQNPISPTHDSFGNIELAKTIE